MCNFHELGDVNEHHRIGEDRRPVNDVSRENKFGHRVSIGGTQAGTLRGSIQLNVANRD